MRARPIAASNSVRAALTFGIHDGLQMSTQLSIVAPALPGHAPAPPEIATGDCVGALAQWVEPIASTMPVLAVGDRFLDAGSAAWLSLPVVEGGRPVGSVSRYELMQ